MKNKSDRQFISRIKENTQKKIIYKMSNDWEFIFIWNEKKKKNEIELKETYLHLLQWMNILDMYLCIKYYGSWGVKIKKCEEENMIMSTRSKYTCDDDIKVLNILKLNTEF